MNIYCVIKTDRWNSDYEIAEIWDSREVAERRKDWYNENIMRKDVDDWGNRTWFCIVEQFELNKENK